MHICSFSSLDELPKKHYGDPLQVLRVLHKVGRFSTFEIQGKLCSTMTWLLNESGWVKSTGGDFQWTTVRLTDDGMRKLTALEEKS
jgi:hypothetical protein